ncbi:iron ABC transporter permease [Gilvimarinus agarilyticus]|uniref:FecCD family ABC transporter permease n=1 Tax=Gilvimarinus sp. 2_MG-2023 TaxID=3062666 RepID=UPI001C09FF82|nr:iron ABC transporter permease [Gilvimarinus sp. 2_MG-2023]MBU2886866.1 iron ABC transporter permease [Gilvimarinus agarilyticus]MDO6571527.1 iron ABC transporter permease [Gilvimarinus sp. 2_MG-2023]
MSDPRKRRRHITWIVLNLLFGTSFIAAIALGSVALSVTDITSALLGLDRTGFARDIVLNIRLPRAILAATVGAVLAVCGTYLQGMFRNPLADPSLIGVTAGASVGASVAIILGGGAIAGGLSLVSLGAFVGGLVSVWLVYRVATGVNGTSVATMLLMGIAVSALAASMTGLMDYLADNESLRRMSLWRMGGLDGANGSRALVMLFILALMLVAMSRTSHALNTLLLGESQARHLGVHVGRLKNQLIVWVALGVGVSVAVAGSIGFVGLVVPHMLRLCVGPDHRTLVPMSALGGASLLLLADTLARVVLSPTELPVGLVTALIGAPFFVFLLLRHRELIR